MFDVHLSAIICGLSYSDSYVDDNVTTMKHRLFNNNGNISTLNWGNQEYGEQRLNNIIIKRVYHTDYSLDAYVLADYTTKKVHVVFRGTQEYIPDLREGIFLNYEIMGKQEAYVSTVYADVIQLMNELNNEDPGWNNPLQVTGHSLGGHLARTFSQISTAMGVPVECVVFNAAIPTVWERGTANDLMIYSDPSMWGW